MNSFLIKLTRYLLSFGLAGILFFHMEKYSNSVEKLCFAPKTETGDKLSGSPLVPSPDLAVEQQAIEECSCIRNFFYPPPTKHTRRLQSSCSDEGTFYTTGQKVVSISMYYKVPVEEKREELYKKGIQANLDAIRKLYPGTSLRLYTNVDLKGDYCQLICNNSDLFWCNIRDTPSLGDQSDMFFMTWRFLPLGDPTVDYFLSRDLDSVVIEREVPVIWDWLQTNKAFHVMRDKNEVHNFPILGGLWGARNNLLGKDGPLLREKIVGLSKGHPAYKKKGLDQVVLRKIIFYPRREDIVAYDSYHCTSSRKATEVRPFPTQRKDNVRDFVGNVDLGREMYNLSKCPFECRPENGKDWEYC